MRIPASTYSARVTSAPLENDAWKKGTLEYLGQKYYRIEENGRNQK